MATNSENPSSQLLQDPLETSSNIAIDNTQTNTFTTIEMNDNDSLANSLADASYTTINSIEPDTPQSIPSTLTIDALENSPSPLPLSRTRSLSDRLNRSTPVLFLKTHAGKMLGVKNPDEKGRTPDWANWVIGLSCFCFLFPSITILALRAWNVSRKCIWFDMIYFIIVSTFSFLSDYVYCYKPNPPLDFATIDQWTATGGVVTVILIIMINPFPLMLRVFNFAILLLALCFIGKSRKCTTMKQWRKWHCVWHGFSGFGLSYIYCQEYMLRSGTIPGNDFLWPWTLI